MEESPERKNHLSDPWISLREFTSSRIALGRSGHSIPVRESLHFKLAHANARDAVYSSLNTIELTKELEKYNSPVLHLHSCITSRQEYLIRPDLGRKLNQASVEQLSVHSPSTKSDVAIIIADGLSAKAINDHVSPLLNLLISSLKTIPVNFAPITIVEQARVAIGDEIGSVLNTKLSLILIGERPGLSSPNSLGAYLTYAPSIGLTDESRNCVSNIRPEGLSYSEASKKIIYLIRESLRRELSGINLKEESGLLN